MKAPARTKFPFRLWHWTLGTESLFDLNADELYTFKLIVNKALS